MEIRYLDLVPDHTFVKCTYAGHSHYTDHIRPVVSYTYPLFKIHKLSQQPIDKNNAKQRDSRTLHGHSVRREAG